MVANVILISHDYHPGKEISCNYRNLGENHFQCRIQTILNPSNTSDPLRLSDPIQNSQSFRTYNALERLQRPNPLTLESANKSLAFVTEFIFASLGVG